MKKVTVVARISNIKRSTKNIDAEDIAYVIVHHEKLRVEKVEKRQLIRALQNRVIECTNLELTSDGNDIKFCNGVKDRYTIIDALTNGVVKSAYTIIYRIENKGKLIGYAVSNGIDDKTKVLKVKEAVAKQKAGEISNGKIRDTSDGAIVSSIEGEYEVLEKSFIQGKVIRACERMVEKRLVHFDLHICSIGTITYDEDLWNKHKPVRYAYVIIDCTDEKSQQLTIKRLLKEIEKNNGELVDKAVVFYKFNYRETIEEALKGTENYGEGAICCAISLDKLKEIIDQGIKLKVDKFNEIALIGMYVPGNERSEIVENSSSFKLNNSGVDTVLSTENFDKVVGMTVEDSVKVLNKMAKDIREDKSNDANEALAQSCECLRIIFDKCLK